MKLFLEKSFIRIFTPVFFVLFFVIGGVSFYVYFQQREHILSNTVDYYSELLHQRSELIHAIFSPTISDLNFLARHWTVVHNLNSSEDKNQLIEDMRLFAQYNWTYRQIRFIGADGMEKVRINWKGDSLVVTKDSQLQDKSHRYYFQKAIHLKPGEIYASPIDLNVEHGKIEVPYQRVIRFATPIFDGNKQLTGIIVINQYLNDAFDRLKIPDDNFKGQLMFLNTDGYWLLGSQKYPSFGFMIDSLSTQKYPHFFPLKWAEIISKNSGAIYGKDGIDIFQHTSINYSGQKGGVYQFNKVFSDEENNWTFVAHVNYDNIKSYRSSRIIFLLILGTSLFLVMFVSYILSRLRFKEKQYLAELNAINRGLEFKIKQRTKELSEKNTELKAVNEELESFSYSVSHDLRAPLRHISGFVDLLVQKNKSDLDEKGVRYLSFIKEASIEMSRLIDDLLRFSRIGRTELKLASFEMNKLVEEVVRIMNEDNSDPEHEIRWEILSLPTVTADYNLIRQVWVNLLSNAIKYSAKKPYSLIRVEAEEKSGNYIFSVQDNGVGFDEKYGHKLFGTFQRLHSSEDYEGTGIGLAIVRRIIVRHGGETWAEGKVDAGATFYFSLPKQAKE